MPIQIPTPNITAQNDRDRLMQMQSYLYRMAQQLQWAFNTIETGNAGTEAVSSNWMRSAKAIGASDPVATFAGLKNLIIKSADIVNAYYEDISRRLEGVYVAQSDFGTYTEQTTLDIQANSNSIKQLYTNYQTIATAQMETNAYIKTGLLGYHPETDEPIYGLEIGQQDKQAGQVLFKKFTRFTAEKLSFYDNNDTEIAYVSDYRMHITNASITGALLLMDEFEVSRGNGAINFIWQGGK